MTTTHPSHSEDSSNIARIDVIDGLRGFAILAVIYHHIFVKFTPPGWHGFWVYGVRLSPFTLLSNGWRGVPLFFILSGCVLYLPYVSGLRTLTSWKDAMAFYKRRARRLLPLYYIHLLILATFLRPDLSPLMTFQNLFWLGTFLMPFHKPFEISGIYNLVIWSLGIEVWFCILMPFIVWTSRRIGMRTVLLLFTVLALLSRFFFLPKATAADFEYFALMTTLGSMLLDFVIGMAIAEEFVQTRQIAQRNPWLAIGIAVTAFSFLISDIAWQEQAPLILSAVNEISIVIGLALFVYGLLLTKLDIVRKVFSNWPLQMIGMMCYSLYLWHAPAFWRLHPELNVYRFIRYATLIFSISFLSYRYIEFGFVHDIRRLLPRRQHKSADQELLTAST